MRRQARRAQPSTRLRSPEVVSFEALEPEPVTFGGSFDARPVVCEQRPDGDAVILAAFEHRSDAITRRNELAADFPDRRYFVATMTTIVDRDDKGE